MPTPSDSTGARVRAWLEARAEALRAFPQTTYDGVRARLRSDDPAERYGALGGLSLAGLMALVLVGWVVLLLFFIPDPDGLERSNFEQATIAFTADGEELTRYAVKNRVWVPLDSISPHVVNALLATEDHRFYRHGGIDGFRLFGAALRTLGGDRQGGSTITMQLARNAYPQIWDDLTPVRKVRELMTAKRLEDNFSKDEILEMYLNTVSFIYQAFGIEAGARTYFQKSAAALDPVESAVLVGMLKGPVYYNPKRNPENSRRRRDVVLGQMGKFGFLGAAEVEELKQQETPLKFRPPSRSDGLAPHFSEYVRQQLDEWAERHGYNLYTDGLKVYTTVDSRLQQAAQEAAAEIGESLQAVADVEWSRPSPPYFSSNAADYRKFRENVEPFAHFWAQNGELLDRFLRQTQEFKAMRAEGVSEDSALVRLRADAALVDSVKALQQWLDVGFLALDPSTGHVKAWVGGRDFGRDQYDRVALARRQPGSTFKPFVYVAAIERGYRANDQLPDSVVTYRDPGSGRTWRPQNVGSASGRLVTLSDALAYSKNTITAQLVADLGPHRVAQTARRMGIQSELDEVPSIGLGTSSVTLLEMTAAYTPLANNGRYVAPVLITRIENRYGEVLATFSERPRSVISDHAAYTVLDMMRGVVERGTGVRIRSQYGARGDLAAKTGTTQNGADGWFMLMHPDLVMGAAVGFNTPSIHFRSNYWGQGAHTALHVVGQFYQQARQAEALATDATFSAPLGWQPPPPPDTTSYPDYYADDYDDLTRTADSLLAATDSLIYRFDRELAQREAARIDYALGDRDRADERTESRRRGDLTARERARRAAQDSVARVPEEQKSASRRAADSLNRLNIKQPLRRDSSSAPARPPRPDTSSMR